MICMQNFITLRQPLLGFYAEEKEEEEERKNNTKNSGLPKLLRWLHALCSDQKILEEADIAFKLFNVSILAWHLVKNGLGCASQVLQITWLSSWQ